MLCFCLCHTLRLRSRRPYSCADKTLNSRGHLPSSEPQSQAQPTGPASLASRRGGSKWVGMDRERTLLTKWVCVSRWGYVRGPDQRPSAHPSGEEGGALGT